MSDSSGRELSRRAFVLSLHPDSDGFRHLVDLHARAIDWRWLLERAQAHKVAALLAARVEECGLIPALDADLGRRFQACRQEVRAHAVIARRTLRRLAEVFAQASIPFFAVKGSVLAEHVYLDSSLRRFVDVDLVVRREMLPQAEAVLRSFGYRFGQVEELLAASPKGAAECQAAEALTRRFFERFQYELPFYEPRGGELLPVDLHWHVASPSRLRVEATQLWEQTVPVVVDGMPITTFNPAATLIHLAIHASTCTLSAFRLLHLCDVAWAATRWRDRADDLWALAAKWGVTVHVAEVLETVEQVLDVPIPLLVWPRRSSLRAPLRRRLTAGFLLEAGRGSDWSMPRRLWGELVWNLAMGCLGSNVLRSIRTRFTRLRWAVWRWRGGRRPAA